MDIIKTLVKGFLAGMAIAIGGTVFLSVDNKVIGSALFTIGLFMVCTHGYSLYTGKVCYVFDNDKKYALNIPIIWLGNLAGTFTTASLILMTRIGAALSEKAAGMCETKLSDNPLSIFILAIFCNMMIYVGVEGYNKNPHEVGKYVALFLCIMVFILSGYEHCIANMFYFTIGKAWSGHAFVWLLIMTAGNAVGGVAIPLLRKFSA